MDTVKREHTQEQAFTQEDYNGLVYGLWEQLIDEMANPGNPDRQEGLRVKKRFSELEGVKEDSPLAIGYFFFWAGVGKGIELVTRLQETEAGA